MRNPIFVDKRKPQPIQVHVGTAVRAYIFGSVARGEDSEGSDIDVYVAGNGAEQIERKYALRRPSVIYANKVYMLHVISVLTVDEETFFSSQPEAFEI